MGSFAYVHFSRSTAELFSPVADQLHMLKIARVLAEATEAQVQTRRRRRSTRDDGGQEVVVVDCAHLLRDHDVRLHQLRPVRQYRLLRGIHALAGRVYREKDSGRTSAAYHEDGVGDPLGGAVEAVDDGD